MNTMQHTKKSKKALLALATTLLLGGGLVLAGCSTTSSTTEIPEDTEATHEDLDISTNPTPLTATEATLSLVDWGNKGALADTDLTILDMLTYAIQDEYTARAEYEVIIDEFNTGTPYTNIIKSEETHIAYLTELFDAYGIALPADTSSTHLAVPSSLLEAAKTGVQAELDNIAMYEKFLAQDGLPEDVKTVFTELMNASKSHLAAFENKVDKLS